MIDHAIPILFVLGLWWLSTSVILKIVWLPRATFQTSAVAFGAIGLAGLFGIAWSARLTTVSAAYVSFASSLAVWGFHELVFLLGIVTGPRKSECPADARGFRRFRFATAVVIHHELALAATLLVVIAITRFSPNQVGTWTFFTLWIMRLSAKLNVFLGVRNFTEQLVPQRLRYMLTYFRKAPLNLLMPFSIFGAGAVAIRLFQKALSADAAPFSSAGLLLVATLLSLAALEHIFLAAPVPDAILWRWATRDETDPPDALSPHRSSKHARTRPVPTEVP